MIVSDLLPPAEDWLIRRLAELERQVRELTAAQNPTLRPVAAATIADAPVTSMEFETGTPPGPTIPTVTIGDSGRCLVTLGASIAATDEAGVMGVDIAGPTPVAASTTYALVYDNRGAIDPDGGVLGASKVVLVEGLAPGDYTFSARYRTSTGNAVTFYDRHLIVQPL